MSEELRSALRAALTALEPFANACDKAKKHGYRGDEAQETVLCTRGDLSRAADAFDRVLSSLVALPAPIDHLEADGMVLVPREPTEAMIEAAVEAEDEICCEEPEPYIRASWTAMLSALPVLGVGR